MRSGSIRIGYTLVLLLVATGATAAGGLAFGAQTITIGPTGPEPSSLRLPAYTAFVTWVNRDSVAHPIEFENGRCTFDLAAGARAQGARTASSSCTQARTATASARRTGTWSWFPTSGG